MEYIVNSLKDRNLKVTPQRVAIARAIQKHGHIDIDKLYQTIQKEFPSISLATLYKNINSFLEKGFIREIAIPNHKSKYELVEKSHAHFICTRCGKVEDLEIDIEKLKNSIQERRERIEGVSLSFYGVCCN